MNFKHKWIKMLNLLPTPIPKHYMIQTGELIMPDGPESDFRGSSISQNELVECRLCQRLRNRNEKMVWKKLTNSKYFIHIRIHLLHNISMQCITNRNTSVIDTKALHSKESGTHDTKTVMYNQHTHLSRKKKNYIQREREERFCQQYTFI